MIFVTVSTGHFDPLIERCNQLRHQYEFVGQIGSGKYIPDFPHFRTGTPEEIESHMERAELVISHAGTGMLSSLYRLRKKSVVIPKQKRYGESNDGQVELARKWAELRMCVLCLNIDEISAAIEQCRKLELSFPQFPSLGHRLNSILGIPNDERLRIAV